MSSRSSTTESPTPDDTVLVGQVRKPHGVRGELVVELLSDVPDRFAPGSELILRTGCGRDGTLLEVLSSRPHAGCLLVLFRGYESRDAAEELRGAELRVRRAEVPPAAEGAYYYFELLGCRCIDKMLGELGSVIELIEDGGGLILRLQGEEGRLLVPFVSAYLVDVDVKGKRIDLDLPEGLVEVCRSR